MDMITYITNFIYSLIRISTPIIFIALGSAISQQGGILNMAAEAMMLTASLAGVMFSAMFQNVWLGILCGMGSAVLLALFLCFASFVMKVDMSSVTGQTAEFILSEGEMKLGGSQGIFFAEYSGAKTREYLVKIIS